jgi:hypothetical protein
MSVDGALMLVGVTISLDSKHDESLYYEKRLSPLPTSNLNRYNTDVH